MNEEIGVGSARAMEEAKSCYAKMAWAEREKALNNRAKIWSRERLSKEFVVVCEERLKALAQGSMLTANSGTAGFDDLGLVVFLEFGGGQIDRSKVVSFLPCKKAFNQGEPPLRWRGLAQRAAMAIIGESRFF